MSNLILFDDPAIRVNLLPFTFTRPVSGVRIGIQTIDEKWASRLETAPSFLTEPYLQAKFPVRFSSDNLYVNGAVCPTEALVEAIRHLAPGEGLSTPDGLLIARRTEQALEKAPTAADGPQRTFDGPLTIVRALPDLFLNNGDQIRADFAFLTKGRRSQPITDPHTRVYAPENIFVEEGAVIRAAVLNAEGGPIYIGRNAVISEGTLMIGPFALCHDATVNWGGKMRNNTTVGPFCKVGGELGNSILFGYSNKAHDGFLGNSVIGEWCNLGANCNNSNLKNDYTDVKLYSYATGQLESSGRLFCGLMMGDHTKAGISTMFNTGTVVGVNVNVYGAGFQPKHIPSFSWGGADTGFTDYRLEKALYVARETVARRGIEFSEADEAIMREVYKISRKSTQS
ncbi:putative sugar nucleotidyl transferase [Tellurirhabdus rosea]|uniref:putative sugar nucleotidyl transferase n=1 Tax=Tellurirhabdus rosea TaxID=2674997 RepID=UPI00224FF07A|nr:putative sugar nucleotidyl transferase [Tellurirhabdus rosea]